MFHVQLMEWYFKIVISSENIIMLPVIGSVLDYSNTNVLVEDGLLKSTSNPKTILRYRSEFLLSLAN